MPVWLHQHAHVVTWRNRCDLQTLVLDEVFYVVALLNLPKLWLTALFINSVRVVMETLVATRRFFEFLTEVEAPSPAHNPPPGVLNCELLAVNHSQPGVIPVPIHEMASVRLVGPRAAVIVEV